MSIPNETPVLPLRGLDVAASSPSKAAPSSVEICASVPSCKDATILLTDDGVSTSLGGGCSESIQGVDWSSEQQRIGRKTMMVWSGGCGAQTRGKTGSAGRVAVSGHSAEM